MFFNLMTKVYENKLLQFRCNNLKLIKNVKYIGNKDVSRLL